MLYNLNHDCTVIICYYSPIERMFARLLRRHVEVLYGWPRLSYYDISPNLVELLAWVEGPDSTIPHHLYWRIHDSIALVKKVRNHMAHQSILQLDLLVWEDYIKSMKVITRDVFQDQDLDALVQSYLP